MKITEVKRKKGNVFYAVVFLGRGATGKPIQRRVSATTKRELFRKIEDLKSKARSGQAITSGNKTVSDLLDDWLAAAECEVANRTYASYKDIADTFIRPTLGKTRLRNLKPVHVRSALEAWKKWPRRDGPRKKKNSSKHDRPMTLSATSIYYTMIVLRTALNWGVKMHELSYNPVPAVMPPLPREYDANVLEPEEFGRLLQSAKRWPTGDYSLPILLAAAAGLRRGELCALRWADVDLKKCTIEVANTLEVRRGRASDDTQPLALKEPKGGRGRDGHGPLVAIPSLVAEALAKWRIEQAKRLGTISPTTPVFDADGDVRHPDTFGKEIWRIIHAADVPNVRLHDLRHSFGSWLANAGTSNRVIQKQLRHRSAKMTERYTKHVEPAQRDAAEALDLVLRVVIEETDEGTLTQS